MPYVAPSKAVIVSGVLAGLVVIVYTAAFAQDTAPQDQAAEEHESLYVYSFRFCASWKLPGETGQEFIEPLKFVPPPITKQDFVDEAVFAKTVSPPGDRRIVVSPIYSMVCGPNQPGVVEGGTEGRTWCVEATASPSEDGSVRVVCQYDIDGVNPDPARTSTGGKPGYGFAGRRDLRAPLGVLMVSQSVGDSSYLEVYDMIERAWP